MPKGVKRRNYEAQISSIDEKIAEKEKSLTEYIEKKKAEINELAVKKDELIQQRNMEAMDKLAAIAKERGITLDDLIKEMTETN